MLVCEITGACVPVKSMVIVFLELCRIAALHYNPQMLIAQRLSSKCEQLKKGDDGREDANGACEG